MSVALSSCLRLIHWESIDDGSVEPVLGLGPELTACVARRANRFQFLVPVRFGRGTLDANPAHVLAHPAIGLDHFLPLLGFFFAGFLNAAATLLTTLVSSVFSIAGGS